MNGLVDRDGVLIVKSDSITHSAEGFWLEDTLYGPWLGELTLVDTPSDVQAHMHRFQNGQWSYNREAPEFEVFLSGLGVDVTLLKTAVESFATDMEGRGE